VLQSKYAAGRELCNISHYWTVLGPSDNFCKTSFAKRRDYPREDEGVRQLSPSRFGGISLDDFGVVLQCKIHRGFEQTFCYTLVSELSGREETERLTKPLCRQHALVFWNAQARDTFPCDLRRTMLQAGYRGRRLFQEQCLNQLFSSRTFCCLRPCSC